VICALLGIDAIMKLAPKIEKDNTEVKKLVLKLEAAEKANEKQDARTQKMLVEIQKLANGMEDLLNEIKELPDANEPLGDDFLRMYNRGTCTGGGATDYCGEEGEVFEPITSGTDS
jgi:hypothetical protein